MPYPEKLLEYLKEMEEEGNEIFTTQIHDGAMWIIPVEELENWIVLITWYEGNDDFNMVNLCDKAYDRLFKIMKEKATK